MPFFNRLTHTKSKNMGKITATVLAVLLAALNCFSGQEKIFSYRSFNPEFEAMKRFAKSGVNTVALFPANTHNSIGGKYSQYPDVWEWFDIYNFDSLDRQFDDVLSVNPAADFVCIVDLNTPIWLSRRMAMLGYSMESDSFTQLSNAVANPHWRKAVEDYLKAFLGHTEKKYGSKIKAYLLACGQTDEWMDYSRYFSARFKSQRWKEWQEGRRISPVDVPSLERIDSASFENFIRDPKTEGDILNYLEFSSDIIASTIEHFAKITRQNISKDKQIGMFFGYILQLDYKRLVSCGHLCYERVFDCPYIDFYVSPGSYNDRKMGQGSGFMCPNGSRMLRGKGWLHEIDHRTFSSKVPHPSVPVLDSLWKTQAEVCAGLKREFSLSIINGASLWCFDMFGGFFDSPDTMALIEKSRKLWERYASLNADSAAEIAFVVDPQSAVYINDNSRKCVEPFLRMRTKLNAVGAPFEVYSFGDLDKADLSKIKLFIFPAMFHLTKERKELLEKYVFKDSKTSLFIHAAGISDGKSLDVSRVKNLTGFEYGTKGVSVKDFGTYKIAYIGDYSGATSEAMRSLAEKSGVKLYADFGNPVYANSRLVAVHTADGGEKTVRLPRKCSKVVELFSGKTVAENADEFVYKFASPDTALFELVD